MRNPRDFIQDVLEGTKAYSTSREDYGSSPEVWPSSTTKISNHAARTHGEAYGGDQAIDWVADCTRLIAETASNANWYFERNGKRMKMPDDEAGDGDKAPENLCGLLADPNPYMDWVEHIELSIIDLLLAGEFFWLKHAQDEEGKPLALYRLSPALMEVIPDPKKFIKHYEFKPPGVSEAIKFQPEQIVHAKLPNPHNQYRGLGIVAGGPRVYDVELALTESLAQFYEQGTRLSGVVSSERRVPEPVFKRIRRQFQNMYSGARNAYKVAVLENGLRFTPIQANAADAQYENLSKLSRDRILYMFRVPGPLIGIFDIDNLKISDAQRIFDTKTMRPFLNRIERIITRSLTYAWDVEFKIDYDYVMPEEERLKLASNLATMPGIKIREVREKAGLEPSTGDPKVDEMVLNLPPTPEELAAQARANAPAGQPGGGEGGRPPKQANLPPSSSTRVRGSYGTSQARLRELRSQRKALSDEQVRDIIDPLYSARQPTIGLIAHNIAREIRPASRELEKALEKVAFGDQKAASDLARKLKGARAWRSFAAAITDTMYRYANQAVEVARNQHRLIGFDPALAAGALDPAAIAALLVNRENGIKSVVGTLKDRVSDTVAEGIERNYSTEQIVNGVHDVDGSYDGLRGMFVNWRQGQAETIAATEAQEYYNEGALRVAEATEHTHVLVVDGEDFDQPCVEANGQVWTIEQARERRTEHPRCTRTFYPIALGGESDGKALDAPVDVNTPGGPMELHVNVAPPAVNVTTPDIVVKPAQVTVEPAHVQVDAPVTVEATPERAPRTVKVVENGKVIKTYEET